jgi:Na+-transporting NADH:ubiquinone oxidoreductase subunit NqrF
VFAYFDGENEIFFVAGEVVNYSDTHQRITRLMPVVVDDSEVPLSSDENVDFLPDFDALIDAISLAPDSRFPFSFKVEVPEGIIVEDNFEIQIQIEAEPAETAHEDLDRSYEAGGEWPGSFFVDSILENPGPDLTTFAALAVAVYDLENRVIAVSWRYVTDPLFFSAGEHSFVIDVEPWDIVDELGLEKGGDDVLVFGE